MAEDTAILLREIQIKHLNKLNTEQFWVGPEYAYREKVNPFIFIF